MNIGFINERKRALNLTNQKIAEQTGITLSTLDKITSGVNTNPKLDTMKALARVLNCSIDDFTDEHSQSLDSDELNLIDRYRALDDYGKAFIRLVIDHETRRIGSGAVLSAAYITPEELQRGAEKAAQPDGKAAND